MSSPYIIPECWADTLLAITLGYDNPNHQMGNSQVNYIMNKDFNNKLAIGIVDNDKPGRQPSDFKKFKELERKHNLILKKGSGERQKHYLIMLSPAVDMWLESVENSVKVTRPYKSNDKEYLKQMKSMGISENQQIKAYFNTIRQKNPDAFKTIKNWIFLISKGSL